MKGLAFIFALLSGWLPVFGQIRIEGYITEKEANDTKALPFAGVILRNAEDSTKVEFSTITDMQGYYAFESVPMKSYLLEISLLGYHSIREVIEVDFPSVGNSIELDYTMSVDDKLLNEVVVTANTVRKGIDKTSYLITPSDLKSARFSMDLLEIIPSVSIDPVSQKIVSDKGKNIKILIDGVSSGEIDLKAIPSNKVARIDYYDVPPARYVSYDAVVNVITKNLEDGFAAGSTLQHAFTTGFANDDLFLKFNRGKHQVSADYTLNHRNYSEVKTATKYEYLIDNKPVVREENSTNPFGYNNHFTNLKYTYQEPDKYVFQAKFSPNLHYSRSEDHSEIQIGQDESIRKRTGTGFDKNNTFNPTLNLYYWKQLADKQSITFDAIGNLFDSHQTISKQEYNTADNHLDLDDRMDLKSLKKSFVGELVYDKTFGTDKLGIGNKIETYSINSKVVNSFDNTDYTSTYFSDYLYADYTGRMNQLMYRATLGLTYKHNNNSVNQYSSWIFRPLLLLGYSINPKNTVRLIFTQVPEEPAISDQSSNVIFVTDNILKKGNPYLKNSLVRVFSMNYGFSDKKLDLNLMAFYGFGKNDINYYYVKSNDYYLFTSLNDKKSQLYGLYYSGAVRSFRNNLLTLKLSGEVTKYLVENDITGNFSHCYMPFRYEILLKWGKFSASHQRTIVSYDLQGTYLNKDENNSHFTLRYTHENFSVTGSWLFAFTPSHYVTRTIPASIVQYSRNRKIYDNQNMFALGFTYTFNSGKEYKEQEKLINNRDSDSGLFK